MKNHLFSFLAIALLSFSACNDDDETRQASVMIVHASPDAPAVDLLVNNSKFASGVTFLLISI